jgi:hypothetical protein
MLLTELFANAGPAGYQADDDEMHCRQESWSLRRP